MWQDSNLKPYEETKVNYTGKYKNQYFFYFWLITSLLVFYVI